MRCEDLANVGLPARLSVGLFHRVWVEGVSLRHVVSPPGADPDLPGLTMPGVDVFRADLHDCNLVPERTRHGVLEASELESHVWRNDPQGFEEIDDAREDHQMRCATTMQCSTLFTSTIQLLNEPLNPKRWLISSTAAG